MVQLGMTVGDEIKFNVCELGVAMGLPRRTVRECLLEGVGIEDSAQLEALVSLYMEKTQNAERLQSRVKELSPQCRCYRVLLQYLVTQEDKVYFVILSDVLVTFKHLLIIKK